MHKITIIGGGTGSFTILSGLKNHPNIDLTAIVTMTDNGGSSGLLRDELGALPAGDTRQCLVALSESADIWRKLFNYRFSEGSLAGQNFGNLFITAIEKITGNFEEALNLAGEILKVKENSRVVPVTLDNANLVAETLSGKIIKGEHNIDLKEQPLKSIMLQPEPSPNPEAIKRILESDLIVICPGDIYTSILPNLLVRSIAKSIKDSRAIKAYICNLMTQKNHTHGYSVIDFVELLEKYLGKNVFDYVVYNVKKPSAKFLKSYAKEGEYPVAYDRKDFENRKTIFLGEDILSQKIPYRIKGDLLSRGLIRHDSIEIASILINLLLKRGS